MKEREVYSDDGISGMMDAIDKRAAEANPQEPEDYIGEDDLLYCGRCHTPRQIQYMGRIGTILCACRDKANTEEREKQRRMERTAELRRKCFPEISMESWTFAKDDGENPHCTDVARKYVEHFDEMRKSGHGLLFYGEPGTGKTYLAACIANALIDKGYLIHMTNFVQLVNRIQDRFEGRQSFIDSLNHYSLLIIDDLGVERGTSYMRENIYTIIDNRYRLGLPMIITTNLRKQDFATDDISLKRIYDRILERCVSVEVAGANRRYKNAKQDLDDTRRLLGI